MLKRGDRSKYSLALDADWESEAKKDDHDLLCIDSTDITNVARWLNHRFVSFNPCTFSSCQYFVLCSYCALCAMVLTASGLFMQMWGCELDGDASVD